MPTETMLFCGNPKKYSGKFTVLALCALAFTVLSLFFKSSKNETVSTLSVFLFLPALYFFLWADIYFMLIKKSIYNKIVIDKDFTYIYTEFYRHKITNSSVVSVRIEPHCIISDSENKPYCILPILPEKEHYYIRVGTETNSIFLDCVCGLDNACNVISQICNFQSKIDT